ncbi:DUF4082 domain-containing protein [Fibrella sp. HMF5335]|uniref:DUF4082 domain-containing protein n=1 Tax=Fibrella rubiginis TaxID=2817060 RepID=A0A939GBC4_9BACT|nr:DUF4082 domain-containing protein [Fibrella rubiginis]MBO0935907.1 DUF4082 domain-containing protein [Fibrella rubiginis]
MKTQSVSVNPGYLGVFLLLLLASTSCKKGGDAKPEETPLSSFVKGDASLAITTRTSGPWELGVVFSSSATGKITKVGSKMPEPGSYRIIIWDFTTKTVLRQKTIEQSSPDALTMEGIDALTIEKSKKYLISINSQSGGVNKKYTTINRTSGTLFPANTGSILLQNACYKSTATAIFPDGVTNVTSELYGYPEFAFVAD